MPTENIIRSFTKCRICKELDDIEDDALLLIDHESYLHKMHDDEKKKVHTI